MSDRELSTLLALIKARGRGASVASVVAEVIASDGPQRVWEEQHGSDLFGGNTDPRLRAAADQVEGWRRAGVQFVSILDPGYPLRLRGVHDAPPVLFYRGNLSSLGSGGVSVVGSRDASAIGLCRAGEIARHLVSEDIPVISGLARGIDAAAHGATLSAGGVPIGVIATGISAPYTPASSRQMHEAVAARGVLISQFQPTAPAMRHTFLERNATMSGLGMATFVIEAGESSGARAQARLAMEHGRPVILTDAVVTQTGWGRSLAERLPANVYVVSNMAEAIDAIDRVRSLTRLDSLDRLLLSSA